MEGHVYVNGNKEDKPGYACSPDALIEVRGASSLYVSRGGEKLQKALDQFLVDPTDAIAMDIGASTGGFTDCLLQHGAKKVYAVDVGYGQLAWSIRNDPRVVVMEKTNIRYMTKDMIEDALSFVTIDVSFISLGLVLPAVVPLLAQEADLICLVKPQFEAGRDFVGKGGVVKDPDVHSNTILKVCESGTSCGLIPVELTFSPIKGPKGNIEFLLHFMHKSGHFNHNSCIKRDTIEKVTASAHEQLDTGISV